MDSHTLLALAAIVLVGMALAMSQFCMVRAVLGVRDGVLAPARCVLGISLAIALSLQLLAQLRGGETSPSYAPVGPVLLGGLVFGMAARANGGCYVGTLNELCCGQWRRLFTVGGWILAFALLHQSPLPAHGQRPLEVELVVIGLAALILLLNWSARRRRQDFCPNPAISALRGPRAWGLMLATGVLMGLLQHSHWPWDPSSLARGLGLALSGAELPTATACALLLPLGMAIVHQWRGQIQPRLVIKEERAIGGQIQQLAHHNAPPDQLLAAGLQGRQVVAAESEVEGAARQSQAAVNAGIGIGRYPGHVDPLHKGQGAAAAAVEEHVIHPAPLLHQHPFVDQNRKAQLPFVEVAGGGQIAAGEAEMVDGHRLGSR